MAEITRINSDRVNRAQAPLVHAVRVNDMVYVSGLTPYRLDRTIAHGNFTEQMTQNMENLKAVLEDAGSGLDRVIKVNVFLKDIRDWPEMNRIYATYFQEGHYPARTAVEARLPINDFLLEIEAVAAV